MSEKGDFNPGEGHEAPREGGDEWRDPVEAEARAVAQAFEIEHQTGLPVSAFHPTSTTVWTAGDMAREFHARHGTTFDEVLYGELNLGLR